MLFKHFLCTVYQTFHDECLKSISSKTFISPTILEMFLKRVKSKNVCIENVYKTFFKRHSVNVHLETFRKP